MISEFLYIGHRGTRTDFDENTFEAFTKAIEFGANYVELDVRKTKDNKLIILHDSSLDRTTTGSGLIKNLVWAEIRNFKTKINYNNIPLLSDVLDKFNGKIKFMIELKGEDIRNDIFDLVNTKGLLKECIFSAKKINDLKGLKKKSAEVKTCYNITKGIELNLDKFLNLGKQKKLHYDIDMINLRSNLVTSEFIEICHSNKFLALAWDFLQYKNPLDKIIKLIDNHIDGILFDNHRNISIIKKKINDI